MTDTIWLVRTRVLRTRVHNRVYRSNILTRRAHEKMKRVSFVEIQIKRHVFRRTHNRDVSHYAARIIYVLLCKITLASRGTITNGDDEL